MSAVVIAGVVVAALIAAVLAFADALRRLRDRGLELASAAARRLAGLPEVKGLERRLRAARRRNRGR